VLPKFTYQLFQEHLLLFVEYSLLIFIRLDNAQKLLRFLHVLLDFFIIGLLIAFTCVLQEHFGVEIVVIEGKLVYQLHA
jgi:hypothetical protein